MTGVRQQARGTRNDGVHSFQNGKTKVRCNRQHKAQINFAEIPVEVMMGVMIMTMIVMMVLHERNGCACKLGGPGYE